MPCEPLIWHGCYEKSWKGIITPDSFKHPAKLSRALTERILDHMFARGWIKRGSIVGDCFGGVACGAIPAAFMGLHWAGVELEPDFVRLGNDNLSKHRPTWKRFGLGSALLAQGDSRIFHETIGAQVDGILTSPPYADSLRGIEHNGIDAKKVRGNTGGKNCQVTSRQGYGHTEGQIGKTRAGTYWKAMDLVYRSCFSALKCGGYIALVIKDCVKNKKVVPICDDTTQLMLHIGFEFTEKAHAMLVKEHRSTDIFGGEVVTTKARKSFFRRLSERNGSPPIDYEQVLFFRKPI